MSPLFRRVLAVVAGVVAGGLVVLVLEAFGARAFPLPAGLDPMDADTLSAALEAGAVPKGALATVALGWLLGPFLGGAVAARLAPGAPAAGLAVGVVFTALTAYNLVSLAHPAWMAAVGLVGPLPSASLGARLPAPLPAVSTT